jgi:hypothetical protein
MNCKKCHKKLLDDTKFCSNCGHAVEIEEVKKETAEIDFYYIPPVRFTILSVLTFGIYPIFWFYKNWQIIKQAEDSKIYPIIRSVVVLYSLPLFEKVIDSAKKHGFKNYFSAGILAMIYILLYIAPNIISNINPLNDTLTLYILFNFLSTLPLLYIQKVIKYNNSKINSTSLNKKFSVKDVIIVLVGLALSIVAFNGLVNVNKYSSFTKPVDETMTSKQEADINTKAYNSFNSSTDNINNNSSTWVVFESSVNGFTSEFPQYPKHETEELKIPDSTDTISYNSYTLETLEGVSYTVNVATYPNTVDVSNSDIILQNILNGTVDSNENNELIYSNLEYFSGYRSIDFLIQNKNTGMMKGKFIIKNRTVYQIFYTYQSANYNENFYNKFINSFEILN